MASADQADALAAELRNPKSFGRRHRVPTRPPIREGFDPAGGYWQGRVWAPTDTMVIRGLERCGRRELARQIALEHLQRVGEVFKKTGTVWENYAPDAVKPGTPAKADFVGWTGIVPILYFLEYAIGLKPDALNNRLTWCWPGKTLRLRAVSLQRPHGYPGGNTLHRRKSRARQRLSVDSDGPFRAPRRAERKAVGIRRPEGPEQLHAGPRGVARSAPPRTPETPYFLLNSARRTLGACFPCYLGENWG